MESNTIFSTIRKVLTNKNIKGKTHEDFIDKLIGNGNLLYYLYSQLYSKRDDFDNSFIHILELIVDSYIERSTILKKRDQEKEKKGIWFLSNELVGMSLYVDRFAGNLKGLLKRIRLRARSRCKSFAPNASF